MHFKILPRRILWVLDLIIRVIRRLYYKYTWLQQFTHVTPAGWRISHLPGYFTGVKPLVFSSVFWTLLLTSGYLLTSVWISLWFLTQWILSWFSVLLQSGKFSRPKLASRRPDMHPSVQRYTSFLRLSPKTCLSLLCEQSLPVRCNGNVPVRVA
jgi:hypothetical protein